MKILKNYKVPTGNILVVEGEKGPLEVVSLGDYGKDKNIVADHMGLAREIDEVKHGEMLPLEEKWVITLSTQYNCLMNCRFCSVPQVRRIKTDPTGNINATTDDLINQFYTAMSLHPEVTYSKRLNIHYARMGEPTFNPNVLKSALYFKSIENFKVHPVVSTMMPKYNDWLKEFIFTWIRIKNSVYLGEAGLQLSINSTNEDERNIMFSNNCLSLNEIADLMSPFRPIGRKFTLNFAIAGYEIDPDILLKYFDPDCFIIKLTPMHKTSRALENNIKTEGDYTSYTPYKHIKESLVKAGYEVIVFIASKEEDESMITCGNAVLSGKTPTI